MKIAPQVLGALIAATIAPVAVADKNFEKKDCPAAVQKTIEEQSIGVTVKGLSAEVEEGKTFYELETTVNGHSKDLLIDSGGKLVSVEEEIPVASLPQAAKAALEKLGKILSAETVTKDGVVSYEAKVESNRKKSEVAVTAAGVIKK